MNIFLRQMAAFAVLWALCELLLPEGSISRTARLVVSLLVMTVLLTSLLDGLGSWAGGGVPLTSALGDKALESAEAMEESAGESYARAYLRSQANQAEAICLRMARGAGYDARAAVYLREDGGLEGIEVRVSRPKEEETPLMSPEELRRKIAGVFAAEVSRVRLWVGEGEAE